MEKDVFRRHMRSHDMQQRQHQKNDILTWHMRSHDMQQRQHQYNDILGWHLKSYKNTLNWESRSKSIDVCHDDDVTEVARFISNEMKTNLNNTICAEISKHNKRAIQFLSAAHKVNAYTLWKSVVEKNAIWDHKPYILIRWGDWTCSKKKNGALKFFHDIWSNIHYGFLGVHVGFTESELLHGAGVAQWKDHELESVIAKISKGGLKGLDDPEDQTAIKIGFDLYKNHKNNLLSELIIEKIEIAYLMKEPIHVEECMLNHYKGY